MFALIQKGRTRIEADNIIVEMQGCSSFDIKRINDKKAGLSQACVEFLNKSLDIRILSEHKVLKEDPQKKEKMMARQAAYNHPLVVEAQKVFNGKIINY